MKELEKKNKNEIKKVKDKYKDLLDEQKLYAESANMILTNQQEEMLEILNKYDESYKEAGAYLGENFTNGFKEKLQGIESYLGSTIGDSSSVSNSSNSNLSNLSIGKNITDEDIEKSNGKTSSINGKSYTIENGNVLSNEPLSDEELKEIYSGIARFKTGGRTKDLGLEGKFVKADSNEMIANTDDTKKFDKMYDYIMNSGSVINQLANTYADTSNYSMPNLIGNNLNGIPSNITNTSSNNSSTNNVSMPITIINQKGAENITEQKIEQIFNKVQRKQATRYGGKKI